MSLHRWAFVRDDEHSNLTGTSLLEQFQVQFDVRFWLKKCIVFGDFVHQDLIVAPSNVRSSQVVDSKVSSIVLLQC